MIAYCLADVFNLDLWPRHKTPVQRDVDDGLSDLVGRVTSAVSSATEVTIRLYGGWHRETLTAPIDMRHMMNRTIENNPKRYRAQRIRVQLADHPIWDAATRLPRSLVESPMTRVSVSLSPSEHCAYPDGYTLEAFRSWCAGRCPDKRCPVLLRQVAQRRRQKMVDTLLTADAMAIIQDGRAHAVVIASDDADMIPALLALSASDLTLTHLRRHVAGGPVAPYDHVFQEAGSHIRSW